MTGPDGSFKMVRLRIVVVAALVVWLASCARAVTGPLEAYHYPLTRALQLHAIETPYYDGNDTYRRVSIRYAPLKKYEPWRTYMNDLMRADGARVRAASLNDRKAFWINTYNAMVIDLVLAHYPIGGQKTFRSIRGVWDEERSVAGRFVTLREVEKTLQKMNDPRIVFALTRAARSSPPPSLRAMNPTQVEDQLEWAASAFLQDPANYRLDRGGNVLHLSSLFEQEAAAFTSAAPDMPSQLSGYEPAKRAVLAFILPRIPSTERQHILAKHPRVVYEPFDWSLNDAR